MVPLVITHGRSQRFDIPSFTQRLVEEPIRRGLESVGSPVFATIPVSLAFYGGHWRPDADEAEPETPVGASPSTALQQQIVNDLFAAEGEVEATAREAIDGPTLNALATCLDRHLHQGGPVESLFLDDVEGYFADAYLQALAMDRVEEAIVPPGDDVILLGHSLGSMVTYEPVRERPGCPCADC